MSEHSFTVGELKQRLEYLDENKKLTFAGGLTFHKFKLWEDDEVILEFNEPEASLSLAFKKDNPHVKVAFIRTDSA